MAWFLCWYTVWIVGAHIHRSLTFFPGLHGREDVVWPYPSVVIFIVDNCISTFIALFCSHNICCTSSILRKESLICCSSWDFFHVFFPVKVSLLYRLYIPWGKFVICNFGLYKLNLNWFDLFWFGFVGFYQAFRMPWASVYSWVCNSWGDSYDL